MQRLARVIATVAWQVKTVEWIKEGGRYIPDLENWIKKGRMHDQPTTTPYVSETDAERLAMMQTYVKGMS